LNAHFDAQARRTSTPSHRTLLEKPHEGCPEKSYHSPAEFAPDTGNTSGHRMLMRNTSSVFGVTK